ncbi:MAG: type II toxin-antitoxin system prevent-host-death family antitoxin [Arenimonas sp.]
MRTELVTTLQGLVAELLSDLERDKQPILIAQRSLPSAYLVNVKSYEARRELAIAEGRVGLHGKQTQKRRA